MSLRSTPRAAGGGSYDLRTEDVAARYGLKDYAVRRMVRLGKLPAINIGTNGRRILRFREADLVKFERDRAA